MTFELRKNPDCELEPFQEIGVSKIAYKLRDKKHILAVSPGGSGKTVIVSNICYRYFLKSENKDDQILIFVHKEELLNGTRKTLHKWYNIISQEINAKTKHLQDVNVFVIMVETFERRSEIEKFFNHFNKAKIIIFDEAHLGFFEKIFVHFPLSKKIGFTATPISANKKKPLKDFYNDIVVIAKPSELIALNEYKRDRGIVPAITYSLSSIDRNSLKKKGEDFDEKVMGDEFKKKKQIQNTINNYIRLGYGKKFFCYNPNIESSLEIHQAFLDAGLNSRHIDGKKNGKYGNDRYRKETFEWFENTPNAILHNVGIATIGTDIPSAEGCIINRSTMSQTLWIQMCVRSSRPYRYPDGTYKDYSIILDMGDNAIGGGLLEPTFDHDWEFIFNNPKTSTRGGIAVIKECPDCGAITYASARICLAKKYSALDDDYEECGFMFPIKNKEEDLIERTLVKITNEIDVKKNIDFFKDKKEYYSYYESINQVAYIARTELKGNYLDASYLKELYGIAHLKGSEWFKLKAKRKYPNFKEDIMRILSDQLIKLGFIIIPEEKEESIDYVPFEGGVI